jgi:cell wall-associated NlpC family hydrolase
VIVCASVLALAGCATPSRDHAFSSPSSLHAVRDGHLGQTRSDPLGSYLDRGDADLAIDYPSSRTDDAGAYGSTRPPKTMVAAAMKFLGVKYRYGGGSPSTGFDCSGLVVYAAEKSLGLKLPRNSRDIAGEGVSVQREDLRKGDLVFFNTLGQRFSHVGIYLGDRKFVHAPRSGAKVRIESMDIAYWRKRYNGARRLHADPEAVRTASRD